MKLSTPCPTCVQYRKMKGYDLNDEHDYWQQNLPDGKWHHPTRFGRAFHKLAEKQIIREWPKHFGSEIAKNLAADFDAKMKDEAR